MKNIIKYLLLLAFAFSIGFAGCGGEDESLEEIAEADTLSLQDLPMEVRDSLLSRFPDSMILEYSKESEEGKTVYDIIFTQAGRKFEADFAENGEIMNWEHRIAESDLTDSVKIAFRDKYPDVDINSILMITGIDATGKDSLIGFEIIYSDNGDSNIVTLSPEGEEVIEQR